MDYQEFLKSKTRKTADKGIRITQTDIHPMLFPFQRDVLQWALRKGRAAVFLDTGLGKTFIQLEWARLLGQNTIIIAPLTVVRQTVREAAKIGLDVRYVRHQSEIVAGHNLWITNYDMLNEFDFSTFGAVVLDESSILKAMGGKTRRKLIDACKDIPYRLCCTATPAPNDNIEIGSHAEFLGICTQSEMLSLFFINANKEHTIFLNGDAYRKKGSNKGGQEWRIKHHAEKPFFEWLSSWAMTMTTPSDLGYDDDGFILPALNIYPRFLPSDYVPEGQLFFTGLGGITGRVKARRDSIQPKLDALRTVIDESEGQWIVWAGLQDESAAICAALQGAVEVKGNDSADDKAKAFEDFQDGKYRILVTKPRIGGFGMNFQNASNMAFFGLSDSWESWYQCIRREWRYGQSNPVDVHVILTEQEEEIYHNVMRKDAMARRLRTGLIQQIREYEKGELKIVDTKQTDYIERTETGQNWTAMLGDSCKRLAEIADNSIDLSVYSPPFIDLYTYTDSERDLGNSHGADEFYKHYGFIIREVLRTTKPGRVTCVHTSDIPAMAQRDGYIGVKDFPGEVIRAHEAAGWVFVGRAFVQKNPQAQAIRTKSKALLFVQLRKDAADSRPALVDQILMFKKPGENAVPVLPVDNGELDNETWIE